MERQNFFSIIPNADDLLELEPEELAGYILEHLNTLPSKTVNQSEDLLNRKAYIHMAQVASYPRVKHEAILNALAEAWHWLVRNGLLAPKPGEVEERVFITRQGKQIKSREDLKFFQKGNLLRKEILHPVIAHKVWSQFVRGEYDTAVFQAFKEVEVAVREAIQAPPTEYGVDLMRKSFHAEHGPLAEASLPEPERVALSNLFAGAIGSYKNPHSHRHVPIEAEEAIEMIMLASHLLRIVNSRSSANPPNLGG